MIDTKQSLVPSLCLSLVLTPSRWIAKGARLSCSRHRIIAGSGPPSCGAVAIRMFYPEWNQYATYMAWAVWPPCYLWAGSSSNVAQFYKARGARYGTLSIVSTSVLRFFCGEYLGAMQNKRGSHGEPGSASRSTVKILRELRSGNITVFDARSASICSQPAAGIRVPHHSTEH